MTEPDAPRPVAPDELGFDRIVYEKAPPRATITLNRPVGPEHGSVPAGGATQWLTIMVGDRRAREIVLMCEEIPAPQAAEWGLVNWAVPADELDTKVDAVVENLAAK